MTKVSVALTIAALAPIFAADALAERAPVLPQIDVPHDYYFREMYLPQLTSGPSSLSWSPDGRELVYSMHGSLWRQAINSNVASQLTSGPGYDYQPDWSPDGRRVVFVRYDGRAMELYLLDIESGVATPLTITGAVNVEPRWSPDGSRIAFVSTADTGRFHVFVGGWNDEGFNASPLFQERQSKVARYYYSAFDHELSPAWSPDGEELLYVSNPEIAYGTGAIWRRSLVDGSKPVLVRKEETTWKARPDWAPDSNRIVYSSYLGRQWHQLWLTTADGAAEPFPLTYGDFDTTGARWSPDGKRIAYVSNASGDLAIHVQQFVGGKVERLSAGQLDYRKPMTAFNLSVTNEKGAPVPARVSIVASDGRSYAPSSAWVHADDGFDRDNAEFETRYFHTTGTAGLELPPGAAKVTVWRGLEHSVEQRLVNVSTERFNVLTVSPRPLDMPDPWRNWLSGDVHVHMNYGGAYRNVPARLVTQAAAEDLDVVFNLIVNKEQRVPDIGYFSERPDRASTADTLIVHSQEFHTSFWGHLGLLGLNEHLLIPDYSAYPGTGAASLYPDNATIATLAHEQGAAVGYVHPFLSPPPDPDSDDKLTNALPVDAALGLVDYYEVVGFADHRASAQVWYRLLNCGLQIAAAGGTDAMANYASLRGPVGVNRTYVRVDGNARNPSQRRDDWLDGLKAGRSVATNGPLLGLSLNGVGPGGELALGTDEHEVSFSGFLRSLVSVDHLELVHNGTVIKTFELDDRGHSADISGTVSVNGSGWLILRAWNDGAHPLIFDLYPYATTSPVFVSVEGHTQRSNEDARYFLAWIGHLRKAAERHEDYNDELERSAILANLDRATQVFDNCRQERD